jgi:hypothetical protein
MCRLEVRVGYGFTSRRPGFRFTWLGAGTAKGEWQAGPGLVDGSVVTDVLELCDGNGCGTELTCCGPAFAPWKPNWMKR